VPRNDDNLAENLARHLLRMADQVAPPETDADKLSQFADPPDPVGFAREIVKITPHAKQALILAAVSAYKRVATVSGHKVGKSTALALLALWFYCSFPNARVVITATTDNQVNGIIWREIKRLVRRAKRAGYTIPGSENMGIKAITGLTNPYNDSEIRGYTAREAEAIAGVSGDYVLYLVDESSGVKDMIFQAIEGNRAGGNAWVFLISNPTKADGEFYDAHHSKSRNVIGDAGYFTIHIDSRDSPNVTGEWRQLEEWDFLSSVWRKRKAPVPGLATPEWVDEKLREWGEESALFKVRVAGLFSVAEDAKCFPQDLITQCEMRWKDLGEPVKPSGRLYIGCDPAGDGHGGDESGFCARRGPRVLELRAKAGLSPARHIDEIEDIIATHTTPRGTPKPVVCIESEGEAGWKVYVAMREYADRTGHFEVARIRTSMKAIRQPLIYDRWRDELWAVARAWARDGGAIPENAKLAKDLHAPEWFTNLQGKQKITEKKKLRELLGRSPDTGDAFVLSCWEPLATRVEETQGAVSPPNPPADAFNEVEPGGDNDPFAQLDWMRR
jgi:phage terminase large subunit